MPPRWFVEFAGRCNIWAVRLLIACALTGAVSAAMAGAWWQWPDGALLTFWLLVRWARGAEEGQR
jgi:hypothetical protein